MKKITVLLFLVFGSHLLFAQKVDTIRKMVNGTPMFSTNDVFQNLSDNKDFSIFISLVKEAGLTDTLKQHGPITIFAPDNKAFQKLGQSCIDTIEKPSHRPFLVALILNHVFAGEFTSKDLAKQMFANGGFWILHALSGYVWAVHLDTNRNIVIISKNTGSSISVISKFDIKQKNGELFVITDVLNPKVEW